MEIGFEIGRFCWFAR